MRLTNNSYINYLNQKETIMRKSFEKSLTLSKVSDCVVKVMSGETCCGTVSYNPAYLTEIVLYKKGGGCFGWLTDMPINSVTALLNSNPHMKKSSMLKKVIRPQIR